MYYLVYFEDKDTYMSDVMLICEQISNDVFFFQETKDWKQATKMTEEQARDIAEQMRKRGMKAVVCISQY